MQQALKIFDHALGVSDPTTESRVSKFVLGVLIPLVPLLYGLQSLMTAESAFPGRFRLVQLEGPAALSAGVVYLAIGLILHVHHCWTEHVRLGGLADFARLVLAVLIAIGLVGTLIGVLV